MERESRRLAKQDETPSLVAQKLFESRADIFDDLAEKHGRNVSPRVVRNGGAASVAVPILHVRTALSDENKAHRLQDAADLARLENGRFGHELRRDGDALSANEFSFQVGLAVLQKHFDDLAEVTLELIK